MKLQAALIISAILVAASVESTRLDPRAFIPKAANQQKTPVNTATANTGTANNNVNNGGNAGTDNKRPGKNSNRMMKPSGDLDIVGLRDDVLEYFVNVYRQRHGVPPIKVDHKLKEKALTCANSYALSQEMKGNSQDVLDNISALPPICKDMGDDMEFPHTGGNTGPEIVAMIHKWYKEMDHAMCKGKDGTVSNIIYNFSNPDMFFKTCHQHFTQLVWKETTSFACAVSTQTNIASITDPKPPNSTNPQYVTVCIFSPGGNLMSSRNTGIFYQQNVFDVKDKE